MNPLDRVIFETISENKRLMFKTYGVLSTDTDYPYYCQMVKDGNGDKLKKKRVVRRFLYAVFEFIKSFFEKYTI